MKVLITGGNGQLGMALQATAPAGFQVLALGSDQLDITRSQQVRQMLWQQQPDLLINSAAYTAVDRAETEPAQAAAVNADALMTLAGFAAETDTPVFHISTDYVFSGSSDRPYQELDHPSPQGVYGRTKLSGERYLGLLCPRHIILRTSWLFSATGKNFVKTMLRLGGEHAKLRVVDDQIGCPTSAESLARVLWQLAESYRHRGEIAWGIYHYANTPACSWYEFAGEILRQSLLLGLLPELPELTAVSSAEYPTPARRPAWSVLDCTQLEVVFGIRSASWREELHRVLMQLREPE